MHSDRKRNDQCTSPPGDGGASVHDLKRNVVLALVMALGVATVVHAINVLTDTPGTAVSSHLQYFVLGALVGIPVAGAAIWIADRVARRGEAGAGWRQHAAYAGVLSLIFTALVVPLVNIQDKLYSLLPAGEGHDHATAARGIGDMVGFGLKYAVVAEPVIFVLALVTVGAFLAPLRRGISERTARIWRVGVTAMATVAMTTSPLTFAGNVASADNPNDPLLTDRKSVV